MKNLRIFMIAAVAATFAVTQSVAQEKPRITESITITDDDAEVKEKVEITNIENVVVEETKGDDKVFQLVETMPEFPGGPAELMKWLSTNIKYPTKAHDKGIQGRVIVQFVVNKDGSIVEPTILRSVDPYLDREAIRVVKAMPKWKPGTQRGEPVRVKFTLPIGFKLNGGPEDNKKNTVVERKTIPAQGNSTKAAFESLGTPAKKVEVMPEFVGGEEAMMQFLTSQADYAEIEEASKAFGQQYIIKFIVGADGKLRDCSILRGIPTEMAEKALSIVKAMPAWKPGTVNGEAKDMLYAVALPFKMTKKPDVLENAGDANSEDVAEKPAEEAKVEKEGEIFQVVEKMPEFPGGQGEMQK